MAAPQAAGEVLLARFAAHLGGERGLAAATVSSYLLRCGRSSRRTPMPAGGPRSGQAGCKVRRRSARLAAVIWTATATTQMVGLNVLTWLTAYLNECGRNGGKPLTGPALERFLPWNASPEDLRTWAQPPPTG